MQISFPNLIIGATRVTLGLGPEKQPPPPSY